MASMSGQRQGRLSGSLMIGLIGGSVAIYLCLIGIVEALGDRSVVEGVISVGQIFPLLTTLLTGYVAARRAAGSDRPKAGTALPAGLLAGLVTGACLAVFTAAGYAFNLRAVFINVSPALLDALTFGLGKTGLWLLLAIGAMLGLLSAGLDLLPRRVRRPLILGFGAVVIGGLFAGLVRPPLIALKGSAEAAGRFLFGPSGLTQAGALIVFSLAAGAEIALASGGDTAKAGFQRLPPARQNVLRTAFVVVALLIALLLPTVSGPFIAQVIVLISISILMGLGMNITLGFSGLLDLGFVAFFAVGAYTTGLLTSYGEYGLTHISFWAVLPLAIFVAMMAGAFLGLPVLGIRGDYLAIATLGFGEIVRLLAGSDFLAPWLGGPQGIIGIQQPCIGWLGPYLGVDIPRVCHGIQLGGPRQIYYLALICAAIIAFIALRLRDSRLGRAWMAIREDEDVAQGLGVNLIQTKLMAYVLGASFAGLGGAIFAVLVGSIFASSMQFLVSINVVAIVVVGGMGSIPGVVVGALALIGLPEAFREFSEFRLLFYGAALIAVMVAKPAGLWPSSVVKRELHVDEENDAGPALAPSAAPE
jgi:branched-chain amino acid transport system permease protein